MTEEFIDSTINRVIETALMEDSGMGDLTSEAVIPEEREGSAHFLLKEHGVVAGLQAAGLVFGLCDPSMVFSALVEDGSECRAGTTVATVRGNARAILRGERVALNLVQRMSGIATTTRCFVRAIHGTKARITDTRKTAPGLRVFDKWAVRLGGGVNHRFGLDDMILIKDNHIEAAGGIAAALNACAEFLTRKHLTLPVEIETRSLKDVHEALAAGGFDRIMLDNFTVGQTQEAVRLIDHAVEVESSGGITLENVLQYAAAGVDFISVGALTHSSRSIDLSLDFNPLQNA